MSGVYVVTAVPGLFARARDELLPRGATCSGGVLRISGAQGTFSMYDATSPDTDFQKAWAAATHGVNPPTILRPTGYLIECTSPMQFAYVVREIAQLITGPAWVLDSALTLWPADAVDPATVHL